MGYGTNGLTFNTLRGANTARLPQFKNSKGEQAHTKANGSDWSPAQWMQALLGELGEWAEVRIEYEAGRITFAEYKQKATKEIADVQTYLDIFAMRALDTLTGWGDGNGRHVPGGCPFQDSPAQKLMEIVAHLGSYANARKKFDRGDFDAAAYQEQAKSFLECAEVCVMDLHATAPGDHTRVHPGDAVETSSPYGVDLGQATMSKFNEVSERVGSNIYMDVDDWHYRKAAPQEDRRK